MKTIQLILLLSILVSCGRKSEITPLVPSRSLVQQYGDGESIEVTLRFPLTESSIDAYQDVTISNSPVLGGLFSSFNKLFYKMGTTFGLGKMKLRIHQVLPEIDPEVFQEMKITKIFFTVDDTICEDPNIDYTKFPICKNKTKKNWFKSIFNFKKDETNFDFIKTAMLEMYPSDAVPAQDTVVSEIKMIYGSFNELLEKTFPGLFDDEIRRRSQDTKDEDKNSKREERKQKREERREKRKEKKEKKKEQNYVEVANDPINDVSFDNINIKPINIGRYYKGKKGVIIGDEFEEMILVKTNDSFNLKKFIKENEKYNKHVINMTSIRGMLFIELKDKAKELRLFMEDLLLDIEDHEKNIKVDSVNSCLEGDCIALEINDVNLIDHLKNKNSVIIDTYLHVKDVPSQNFQLKGFVEFKVKFKLAY